MKLEKITWRTGLLALLVSFFWGGNTVALKIGLATFPPAWSAFWRMITGLLVVALWARSRGTSIWPGRYDWGPLLSLAGVFVIQILALNFGTDWTSPGYAVILINIHPLFTNFLSHFVLPEDRLSGVRLAGLALAFAGVAWLVLGEPEQRLAPQPILGNLTVTASAALLATRVVYTQRLVRTMDPILPVVWQMAASLPAFLAVALILETPLLQPVTWAPVAAILYQGAIVAGLCFVVWTTLLQRHPAGALSMFGFTVPVFGVIVSALVFDEAITDRLVLSIVLVTAGIALVTRKGREPRIEAAAEQVTR